MKKLLSDALFWRINLLVLADCLFFSLTDPQTVAAPLLIIGFTLFIVSLYIVLCALAKAATWYGLPLRHGRRLARVMTLISAGLVALQSMGQLSSRDALVLLPLTLLAYAYNSYVRDTRPQSER